MGSQYWVCINTSACKSRLIIREEETIELKEIHTCENSDVQLKKIGLRNKIIEMAESSIMNAKSIYKVFIEHYDSETSLLYSKKTFYKIIYEVRRKKLPGVPKGLKRALI